MKRRRVQAALVGMGLGVFLAACGGDGEGAVTTVATTPTTVLVGSDAIEVDMTDHAFAVSGALKSGGTFRLRNSGREFHMMGLAKLKPGKTLDDVKAALAAVPPGGPNPGDDPTEAVVDDDIGAPGTFVGPGQSVEVTAPALGAGTYAMVCFIPVEGGGPPHFTRGMISEVKVTAEEAPVPRADATYTIAPGKAVEGPRTLTVGRHVLEIRATPGSEQLEPSLFRLDPGKTVKDINQAGKSFETAGGFVLPPNAADRVPGDIVAMVFDVQQQSTIYLGLDLVAGTYAIDAHDTDIENDPLDPPEKIVITVR